MRIYTRAGDDGSTGILGGKRVKKSAIRLHAYGTIDELNAVLGAVLASQRVSKIMRKQLLKIQSELFEIGTDLATPIDIKMKVKRVSKRMITQLERWIDGMEKNLPLLKNFILPGGARESAQLHLARTVCRRAERWIVELAQSEEINPFVLQYVNRLSDYMFVAARSTNKDLGVQDEKIVR